MSLFVGLLANACIQSTALRPGARLPHYACAGATAAVTNDMMRAVQELNGATFANNILTRAEPITLFC